MLFKLNELVKKHNLNYTLKYNPDDMFKDFGIVIEDDLTDEMFFEALEDDLSVLTKDAIEALEAITDEKS